MAELFGFRITRAKNDKQTSGVAQSVAPPSADDGTIDIAGGGFYSSVLSTDGRDATELDLIRRYRDIAQQAECDSAIEDITNEAIVSDERGQSVSLSLDKFDISQTIKQKIREEFDEVLRLLDFNSKGHDIFRRWYVDGRLFYHKIIDESNPRKGIKEVRYIDPRKIKKVREKIVDKDKKTGLDMTTKTQEYYLFNKSGNHQVTGATQGIKISPDSISYCPSGLVDMHKGTVLSHLHKAIKPVNQLRMIEDSLVIYRISRAPERRIFYIDVGNLPKIKAEAYLKDVMNRYRNKLVYDASTGEIRDDRNHMSMLEDFWLPRREGGRGTEITTLPGGQNLGELTDVQYFQKKLFRALNVPESRTASDGGFNLGRSSEILRDELMFGKFVGRLRKRFSNVFHDILKTQLILKNIVTPEDWEKMSDHIQYDYLYDGHFSELKETELMNERLNLMVAVEPYIGRYYSEDYVRRKILRQTDQEIVDEDKLIEKEIKDGKYTDPKLLPPVGPDGMPLDPMAAGNQPMGAVPKEPDISSADKATTVNAKGAEI